MEEHFRIELKYKRTVTEDQASEYDVASQNSFELTGQFLLDTNRALFRYGEDTFLYIDATEWERLYASNKKFVVTLGQINNVALLKWV